MSSNEKDSFTSANSMPLKVIGDKNLLESIIKDNKIIPIHMQISPTNKCNLSCTYCSMSDRDKKEEMSLDELKELVDISSSLGTKAYTVTGGGSPCMHKDINKFLQYAKSKNISLGLVDNGLLLNRLTPKTLETLTWARISFDDDRKFDTNFLDKMDYAIKNGPTVDWAFSYVVSENYDINNIKHIIQYANRNNFTHVRMVPDLYNVDKVDINGLEKELQLDDSLNLDKVIFQQRQSFTHGDKNCLISLLKPLIASDGNVYACCGLQYSEGTPDEKRTYRKNLSMGHFRDLPKIISNQKWFDGSICNKCYYKNYNTLLNAMTNKMKHGEFL